MRIGKSETVLSGTNLIYILFAHFKYKKFKYIFQLEGGETLAAAVDIPATAADTPATAGLTATAVHTAQPRIITEERGGQTCLDELFLILLTSWLFLPLFRLLISY